MVQENKKIQIVMRPYNSGYVVEEFMQFQLFPIIRPHNPQLEHCPEILVKIHT